MTDLRLDCGLHDNIEAADYHADPAMEPSLSSSIAKLLLDSTPRHAWTAHPRLNPDFAPEDDDRFDLGSVAHELILGRGGGFDVVPAPNWASKEARDARKAIRAAGRTPVLTHQFDSASRMADAVLNRLKVIPESRNLFGTPQLVHFLVWGFPERVGIWRDAGGALCRMMLDWHGPQDNEVWDIKTTSVSLSDDNLSRLIVSLGYDMKAAFYLRGLSALLPQLSGRFKFRWIFCQTDAPHEVRLIEPSGEMLAIGDRKAALAIEKWRRCIAADDWPGYPPNVTRLEPPDWSTNAWMRREEIDPDALMFHPSFANVRQLHPAVDP